MDFQHWFNAALKEYDSLRTESLTAMKNQQSTLQFGTAVLGVSLGLAFNVQDPKARFLAFSVLIPVLSLVFFILYAIEFGRMVRVGRYIDAVERRINALFTNMEGPLGWEQWLEHNVGNRTPRLAF